MVHVEWTSILLDSQGLTSYELAFLAAAKRHGPEAEAGLKSSYGSEQPGAPSAPFQRLRRDCLPRRLVDVRIARSRWHELPALSRAHAVPKAWPDLGHRELRCSRGVLGRAVAPQ